MKEEEDGATETVPSPGLQHVVIPGALKGRPPTKPRYESDVNAWGPFYVYLEDSPVRPAYIGSRLRFDYDGHVSRVLLSFFPVGPPSSEVYTVAAGQGPRAPGGE